MPVAELAALIAARQPCVVLTGAGVSTESGIPDFRSPTGIWAEVDPFEVASIQAFHRAPERVWAFYRLRIHMLLEAEPNAAHFALAELERRGRVRAVVTQNIDTLHTRAGSSDVVEVHGSIGTAVCPACGYVEDLDRVLLQLEQASAPALPRLRMPSSSRASPFSASSCPAPRSSARRRSHADAELMLVVGSSLEVWPVAGLPLESRALAIVNRGPTALDDRAALRIDAAAGETLAAVLELVG